MCKVWKNNRIDFWIDSYLFVHEDKDLRTMEDNLYELPMKFYGCGNDYEICEVVSKNKILNESLKEMNRHNWAFILLVSL